MLNSYFEKENGGSDLVRVYIKLSGRVQGVAFRYYARDMAYYYGVKGWIKNLENGEVEAVIEGSKAAVKKMIFWCKKGPALAIVENIEIDWQDYSGEFNDFNIQ